MKKISKSQARKNRKMDKIKHSLPSYCCLCGRPAVDPAHLLPRSEYPEYYTEEWNVVSMCRDHHNLYDGSREFRRSCTELVNTVRLHDERAANRYFGL